MNSISSQWIQLVGFASTASLVFAIADRVVNELQDDHWSAMQLQAAITFWGAPPGQSTARAARPLAESSASSLLTEAIKLARGEGPASA